LLMFYKVTKFGITHGKPLLWGFLFIIASSLSFLGNFFIDLLMFYKITKFVITRGKPLLWVWILDKYVKTGCLLVELIRKRLCMGVEFWNKIMLKLQPNVWMLIIGNFLTLIFIL
jgi:hypothetical protein